MAPIPQETVIPNHRCAILRPCCANLHSWMNNTSTSYFGMGVNDKRKSMREYQPRANLCLRFQIAIQLRCSLPISIQPPFHQYATSPMTQHLLQKAKLDNNAKCWIHEVPGHTSPLRTVFVHANRILEHPVRQCIRAFNGLFVSCLHS